MVRKTPRTRVPVANRDLSARPKTRAKTRSETATLDVVGWAIIGLVVILVLFVVYVPAQNYFSGKAEIARLQEEIAANELAKEELTAEIAQYQDEEFIRQEARRRLGVVEPGETAWRIIDPRLEQSVNVTTASDDEEIIPEWYEVLWDSLTLNPSVQ